MAKKSKAEKQKRGRKRKTRCIKTLPPGLRRRTIIDHVKRLFTWFVSFFV